MFENGEREFQQPKATAQSGTPEGQEATVVAHQGNTTLEKDPQAQQAKTTEQPNPTPEKKVLSAAEKLQLKEKATTALNQLVKEASRVTSAPDYFAALGLIPGQADIKNGDRVKTAYWERARYFHPDRANRRVHEILGDVSRLFPELADQAQTARLACEEATKKLNEANDFLKDAGRREKYLSEKYQIRAGIPEAQSTQQAPTKEASTAARTASGRSETTQSRPTPDWVKEARESYAKGFRDWREAYQSDAWQDFTRNWNEQYQPFVERPKDKISLMEMIRDGRGERYLNELRTTAQEAIQDIKDLPSLKRLLEIVLAIYDILKSRFSLKREKRGLPVEITMMSLKGMLAQLNRPEDGNQRWMTRAASETRLSLLKNSFKIILDYLKPEPLGPNPFRNKMEFNAPAAASR